MTRFISIVWDYDTEDFELTTAVDSDQTVLVQFNLALGGAAAKKILELDSDPSARMRALEDVVKIDGSDRMIHHLINAEEAELAKSDEIIFESEPEPEIVYPDDPLAGCELESHEIRWHRMTIQGIETLIAKHARPAIPV